MNRPLLILATAAAFTFASCDNANTTNPEPLGTVTIKGAIVANLDEDEDVDNLEKIPAGVAVYVINEEGAILGTTTTTADGYTIDIQIGAPQDVAVIVGDFQVTIVKYDGVEDDFINMTAVYDEGNDEFVTIEPAVKGATYIRNIELSQPEPLNF